MTAYPGFSTARMDAIFAHAARVAAMVKVEAAVATAQAGTGAIPDEAAAAIVTACAQPVDARILADGWEAGTPVLPMLEALKERLPATMHQHLHRGLTTQDVVDTATMCLIAEAVHHLGKLADAAAMSLKATIAASGSVSTAARSFLQPADVTTFGFRLARWLQQLDHGRARLQSAQTPVQLGGLIGDRIDLADDVVVAVAEQLGLDVRAPWHTDRSPIVDAVNLAGELARWAAKIGVDIAQLTQLGEVTTRAGGSSAAAGKRNPIDAMRAVAAAEVALGVATVITHAKPLELERGLGSWHAEWFAVPVVFQAAAAAMEATVAALTSLRVEPSTLAISDERRIAADGYVTSVLEQSP
jgi:3-carboxy-cis,cis-muconate cycloisomerase